MKLVHPILGSPIEFEENKVNVLIVENQKVFSKLIIELLEQIHGAEGEFIFSQGLNQLDLAKEVEIITDVFKLDFNQKKIISKLYHQLKATAIGNEYYLDTACLLGNITQFLEHILQTTQYPIAYSQDIDVASIFKIAEIKIETIYETICEKIIDYLSVMQDFCGTTCFIFANLKCYLSPDEIEHLYSFVAYNKFNILLLENTVRDIVFEQEKIRIIDTDLCEI